MTTRDELVVAVAGRYAQGSRAERGRILDEFAAVTGLHQRGAGISQEKLPLYLGFFQFVHNAPRRGKALLGTLLAALVA